jgi:hypothetical protein
MLLSAASSPKFGLACRKVDFWASNGDRLPLLPPKEKADAIAQIPLQTLMPNASGPENLLWEDGYEHETYLIYNGPKDKDASLISAAIKDLRRQNRTPSEITSCLTPLFLDSKQKRQRPPLNVVVP